MTNNADYGTVLFDLLRKADDGDPAPLDAYLAADPARAVSADRTHVLVLRHQYGTFRNGHWFGYSAQPDRNPWPGSPTRMALVLVRSDVCRARSWHELTLPADVRIADIRAEGSAFSIRVDDGFCTATGDQVFRVIADCSFGPPGVSEIEIMRGFDKLAGRAALEVVGPTEPDALLGSALPLILDDAKLGRFKFWPERPARYLQTREHEPTYLLFAGASGSADAALARAREIVPGIQATIATGARLVQAVRPDFKMSEARLLSAEFRPDRSARITIDDGIQGSMSADLDLGTDGNLSLVEIEDS